MCVEKAKNGVKEQARLIFGLLLLYRYDPEAVTTANGVSTVIICSLIYRRFVSCVSGHSVRYERILSWLKLLTCMSHRGAKAGLQLALCLASPKHEEHATAGGV